MVGALLKDERCPYAYELGVIFKITDRRPATSSAGALSKRLPDLLGSRVKAATAEAKTTGSRDVWQIESDDPDALDYAYAS